MDDNSESDERDSAAVRMRSPKAPKSPWWLLFWLAVLAVLLCYLHGDRLANQLGVPIGIAFAIITLANVLLLPLVLILAVVIISLIHRFLFRSEHYDFSRARKSAGEEGTVVRLGQVVIWFSGVGKGMQMLEDEFERTRRRFADLVGEPVEADSSADPTRSIVARSMRILFCRTTSGFLPPALVVYGRRQSARRQPHSRGFGATTPQNAAGDC